MKNLFKYLTLGLTFATTAVSAQNYCSVYVSPEDTTICVGDSILVSAVANLVNGNQAFDFNTGSLPPGWNSTGGTAFSEPCGANSTGTPYYWASTSGAGTPTIGTGAYDISCGGVISFEFKMAIQSGASPCEGPDQFNEGISIQYSTNGGTNWTTFSYMQPDGQIVPTENTSTAGALPPGNITPFTDWDVYTIPIPAAALSATTEFRWTQINSSGTAYDNWGLDNVIINATGAPCGTTTVVNWDNGFMDTTYFYAYPTADTSFIAQVYDTLGNYQCESAPINITVFADGMTYDLADTVYSLCPDTDPLVEVTNFANAQQPFTVDWTTIPSTNNPENLSTGGAEHDTIVYPITIYDGCQYFREDSVILIVNKLLNIDTLLQYPSNACDPDGAVSAIVSGITIQSGQPSYEWRGPGPGSPNFINATVFQNISSGWYYFTVEDDVCTDFDSVFVEPLDPPIAEFSPSVSTGCGPLAVTFENTSQNTNSYEWDFGDGNPVTTTDLSSQNFTFLQGTTVQLIASSSPTCSDTATVFINVEPCGCTDPEALNYNQFASIDDGSCIFPTPIVTVPNVFTPNGDNINDLFFLDVQNYSKINLVITNRWGNVVYSGELETPGNPGWDGTMPSGSEAYGGVYFYKYIVTSVSGDEEVSGHGHLTLVRE